jgi:uridine kinase
MDELRQRLGNLIKTKDRPIIFICGLGGSGKTTFSRNIAQEVTVESVAVHSDWWAKYSTVERKKRIKEALDSGDTFRIEQEENPQNWYDVWEKLGADLLELQSTGSLVIPDAWNQKTGEKDLKVELSVPERGLIIFDGIYLLHPEIADIADCIVLLDVPAEICQKRAEQRDSHRSEPDYLAYKASLMKKYDVPYIEKYRDRADLVITQ